jgi:hypothetical protein
MSGRKGTLANSLNSTEKTSTGESLAQQLAAKFSCPHAIERQQACILFFSAVHYIRAHPDHMSQARIGEIHHVVSHNYSFIKVIFHQSNRLVADFLLSKRLLNFVFLSTKTSRQHTSPIRVLSNMQLPVTGWL